MALFHFLEVTFLNVFTLILKRETIIVLIQTGEKVLFIKSVNSRT